MSIKNWYPFYVGDYKRDTAHLSLVEHGAYRVLLDYYFSHARPIPANAMQMHRICSAFDKIEQDAVAKIIDEFFYLDAENNCYRNSRADKELQKKQSISQKRSEAASKRHNNDDANAEQMQSNCNANEMQKDTHPHPHPHNTSKETSIPPKPPKVGNALFDEFYRLYPKKIARAKALKAYESAIKAKASHESIMEGLKRYVCHWEKSGTDPQFIPHPTSWLNAGRWDDQIPQGKNGTHKPARESNHANVAGKIWTFDDLINDYPPEEIPAKLLELNNAK